MQALKPTLLREVEKVASTLHLNLSALGLVYLSISVCVEWGVVWALVSWAFFQLLRKVFARAPFCWVVPTTLFHTLLFLCFHILHKVTANIWFWAISSCWSNWKIMYCQHMKHQWTIFVELKTKYPTVTSNQHSC